MTAPFYINKSAEYKVKFYQRKHHTKQFKELTEEQITKIKKEAETRKKTFYNERATNPRLDIYIKTLAYLTSPTVHMKYKTFDERMLFLIFTIDPELNIAKLYTTLPLITQYEEKHKPKYEELTEEEQKEYIEKRKKHNETLKVFNSTIFEQYSITDPDFVYFERIIYAKDKLSKQLATNIQANYTQELLDQGITVRSFERTTDEQYENIQQLVQNYIINQTNHKNPNTVAFNLLRQNKLIGGDQTYKQIFLVFILTIDPELNALKIFYEETRWPRIKQRCIEEMGFFHKELIRLEDLYHKRFMPDKKISDWQI